MKRIPLIILLPLVWLAVFCAFFFGTEAKLDENFFKDPLFLAVLAIATAITVIIDALDRAIDTFKLSLMDPEERKIALAARNKSFFDNWFNKQSDKEEEALILDHGFDGITELDNNLPKWWLGILYVTMVYAVIYVIAASGGSWANPNEEYKASIVKANKEKKKPTLEQMVADAKFDEGMVAAGQKIFETNCVTCHLNGGAGSTGPNLTDDAWKNLRTDDLYTNIVDVVWSGAAGGAMQAWGDEEKLSPEEVYQVAAYVKSLQGIKPPGKPKQAEGKIAPWAKNSDVSVETTTVTDSATVVKDSVNKS